MRGHFAYEVYKQMVKNKNIWVITTDLGYKMFDRIKSDFPDRFINAGAAEQASLNIAVGLALEEKIPIVYSITTFLLFRPFETIRNYINYERIPVKLVGGGRGKDYLHDGRSHWPEEEIQIMAVFKNIKSHWPNKIEEIPSLVKQMLETKEPWYINLRR